MMDNHERLSGLIRSRRPGWSLSNPFYTDPWIFQEDMNRIFFRHWLFAGHTRQIPNPCDYFTFEIGDESIIIIRGDEAIHGHFNVCRHRGSRICLETSGHARSLVCPYHQWVYKPDGSLTAARLMPGDFDKARFGLHRVHVRVVEGLIFISLAEEPTAFDTFETDLRCRLKPHLLEKAKICHTRHYDVRANWKLVIENSRECYHCGQRHPEYCRTMMSDEGVDSLGGSPQREDFTAERKRDWKKMGLETTDVNPEFPPDAWYKLQRYPVRQGLVTQSLDGQPVAPLMGNLPGRDTGVLSLVMRHHIMFQANSDHVAITRMTPMAPQLTKVRVDWLVRDDAEENVDYEIERLTPLWRITCEQDWKLCEDNQLGVNSSRYEPGPYAPDEIGAERFVQWYLNQHDGLSSTVSRP